MPSEQRITIQKYTFKKLTIIRQSSEGGNQTVNKQIKKKLNSTGREVQNENNASHSSDQQRFKMRKFRELRRIWRNDSHTIPGANFEQLL